MDSMGARVSEEDSGIPKAASLQGEGQTDRRELKSRGRT